MEEGTATPTRRPTAPLALIVVLGASAIAWFVLGVLLAEAGELPDPDRFDLSDAVAEPVAVELRDGTPIWLIHHEDGLVQAIEAISTHHATSGMAWCPSSRSFVDVVHGSTWDDHGRYFAGPARSDLVQRVVSVDGTAVEIGAVVPVTGRSLAATEPVGPSCHDVASVIVHPAYGN